MDGILAMLLLVYLILSFCVIQMVLNSLSWKFNFRRLDITSETRLINYHICVAWKPALCPAKADSFIISRLFCPISIRWYCTRFGWWKESSCVGIYPSEKFFIYCFVSINSVSIRQNMHALWRISTSFFFVSILKLMCS